MPSNHHRIAAGSGGPCRYCRGATLRYRKRDGWRPLRAGQVFYAQWDYCKACRKVTYDAADRRES